MHGGIGVIEEGAPFPQGITLPDHDGDNVHLDQFIGKQPVVLFFYPHDHTPGCTRQACSFRDRHEGFQSTGAAVFGVSGDSPRSHRSFRDRHDLPYPLLSDQDGVLRKRLDIPRFLGIDARVTIVVDGDGQVTKVFKSQIQATRHVKEALQALETAPA